MTRTLLTFFLLLFSAPLPAQDGPAGGRLPEKKSTATPAKTTTAKTPTRAGTLDRIDAASDTTIAVGQSLGVIDVESEPCD